MNASAPQSPAAPRPPLLPLTSDEVQALNILNGIKIGDAGRGGAHVFGWLCSEGYIDREHVPAGWRWFLTPEGDDLYAYLTADRSAVAVSR